MQPQRCFHEATEFWLININNNRRHFLVNCFHYHVKIINKKRFENERIQDKLNRKNKEYFKF